MIKNISSTNVNMLIVPLTDHECDSLENCLIGQIVGSKNLEEFVCVVGSSKLGKFSLVSYGRYDQVEFSEQEKSVLNKEIAACSKEWLKANTNYIF
ncbi:hypothetical protein [Polynucleobacter sp.]|uniref:hypothetical protein n=1 Tax=Polynucleobacter sp. TaxID=2029855 RepID=UPI003F6A115C